MLFLIVIFLAAFLLFQVQPLIAKQILPYFGGGSSVWTTCMLFFQGTLLLGYGYSHLIAKYLPVRKQLFCHASLLVLSLLLLPIGYEALSSEASQSPLTDILLILFLSVGVPYFTLSATAPLVQKWFALVNEGKSPYFLYSWSNAASLLALLSFPFVIEPVLSSSTQNVTWSLVYAVFVAAFLSMLWQISKSEKFNQVKSAEQAGSTVKLSSFLFWFGYSALGVIFLVATTNAITQNVAPIPFLWILPLCLYLLSFIVCFHHEKWYVRWYWLAFLALCSAIAIFLFFIGAQFDFITQLVLFSCVLFTACMVCHGELARAKPDASQLTPFYLTMSFGGFAGSVFIALIAPQIWTQFLEFPLAFIVLFALIAVHQFNQQGMKKLSVVSFVIAGLISALFVTLNSAYQQTDIYQERNFFGVLSVKEVEIQGEMERRLIDGTTSHGTQYVDKNKHHIPLSYFRAGTGGALAIQTAQQNGAINAGFIGLGAGALAAYGKAGDTFTFYELNPSVINAANNYFTFLSGSKADVKVIEGDARLSLASLANSDFKPLDLLVLDAFSGDSIPQHLITVEAIKLYQKLVKEQGILAFHISNSHLHLLPLMVGLSKELGYELMYFRTKADYEGQHDTDWVWMTNNPAVINSAKLKLTQTPVNVPKDKQVIWTDDFSHLLSLLK